MDKTLSMILAGSAIFVFSACQVDSDYNLEKLDTKVTILKNAEFPVPDMTPFKLGDYLDMDGYEYIVCDEKGDYQVSFALEPMTATVTLPDLGDQDRIQTDYKPVVYGFDSVPDFLYSQDGQIAPDLSEMEVHVEMDSEIPAEFSIGSTIETLRSGAVQHKYVIDNLPIRQGKNDYWLMEEPTRENGIAVPELGNLLSPFPDALKMSDLTVYSTADQRALVSPGTEYGLTLKASVSSPVCFKADNRFTLSFPIDAKLDLEQVGLKQAILYLDYENTIPLNFSLSAHALDASGKRLDSIKAETESDIVGSTNGFTSVRLTTQGDLRFASMVLELTVSSDSSLAGIHINRDQRIRFYGMHLWLPDGIQIDLDSNQK